MNLGNYRTMVLLLATFVGIGGLTLAKILQWETPEERKRRDIKKAYDLLENKGLGYASGLADNYFLGYLNLILPEVNQENPGIAMRIKEYKTSEKLSSCYFPEMLFVIVSGSGYAPETFAFKKRINAVKNLRPVEMNRGGIKNRSYQTSVYCINNGNDQVFVAMEAAACLRQLHESAKTNKDLSDMLPTVISTFMAKLTYRIEQDMATRGKAEIVYITDFNEDQIADCILRAIERRNLYP